MLVHKYLTHSSFLSVKPSPILDEVSLKLGINCRRDFNLGLLMATYQPSLTSKKILDACVKMCHLF